MATFQPSYSSMGNASYHIEAPDHTYKLEPFLWKLLLVSALAYFVWSDTISIDFGPISIEKAGMQHQVTQPKTDLFGLLGFEHENNSDLRLDEGALDNLSFVLDPTYAARFGISGEQVQAHMERCSIFVKRFSPVAIAEMRRYGVPASLLLAQALLASDAGDNPICRETNNFFLRSCQPAACTVEHFADLESTDQVILVDEYPNLWGSFRAQSIFLKHTAPFSDLFQVDKNDYRTWAKGLESGGYSMDAEYGKKLIAIIQGLQLEHFDAYY